MAYTISEIDETSILTLLSSGFTHPEICDKCNVSLSTVGRYAKKLRDGKCDELITSESYDLIKKNIESRLAIQASKYLGVLQTSTIPEPTRIKDHKDLAITFGILHQHYRLASGQSTENQAVNVLSTCLGNMDKSLKAMRKIKGKVVEKNKKKD